MMLQVSAYLKKDLPQVIKDPEKFEQNILTLAGLATFSITPNQAGNLPNKGVFAIVENEVVRIRSHYRKKRRDHVWMEIEDGAPTAMTHLGEIDQHNLYLMMQIEESDILGLPAPLPLHMRIFQTNIIDLSDRLARSHHHLGQYKAVRYPLVTLEATAIAMAYPLKQSPSRIRTALRKQYESVGQNLIENIQSVANA